MNEYKINNEHRSPNVVDYTLSEVKPWYKKRWLLWGGLSTITVIVIVTVVGATRSDETEYSFGTVERGRLVQTVTATGKVEAASELALNFKVPGVIGKINVERGATVKSGDLLAELKADGAKSEVVAAMARVSLAAANLAQLEAGARLEEVNVSEQTVSNRYLALKAAESDYQNLLDPGDLTTTVEEQAVITATDTLTAMETQLINLQNSRDEELPSLHDTAVRELNNAVFVIQTVVNVMTDVLNDDELAKTFSIKDPQLKIEVDNDKNRLIGDLNVLRPVVEVAGLTKMDVDLNMALDRSAETLNRASAALDLTYAALLASVATYNYNQTTLDATKTNVQSTESVVKTALSNAQTAKFNLNNGSLSYRSKLDDAESALLNAKNALQAANATYEQALKEAKDKLDQTRGAYELADFELKLKTAKPTDYELRQQRARLAEARAALAAVEAGLEDTGIRAPIDGLVSKINYQVGEQVLTSEPAIQLIGENNFRLRVNVAEADVVKLRVGQEAEIILDSFGQDSKFHGTVSFIEQSPTLLQDVVYYRADITMDKNEVEIRPGMTADATIITIIKNNALYIPQRAVITESGKRVVRFLNNGTVETKEVVTGLRADGGLIEVLTGLTAGEEIITLIRDNDS